MNALVKQSDLGAVTKDGGMRCAVPPYTRWSLRFAGLLLLAGIAGCAPVPPPCQRGQMPQAGSIYLVQHGWHTDLAIPSAELRGNMLVFQQIFPGLRVLMIGFGKRTFMMAPVKTAGDLVLGPFPGDGSLLFVGLNAPPDAAYDHGTEAELKLPPGGAEGLSNFIWNTLQTDHNTPVRIGNGFFPGSVFYATLTRYSGSETCNTWTAAALHAAGLNVHSPGVVFAGQTMRQARNIAGGACAINARP